MLTIPVARDDVDIAVVLHFYTLIVEPPDVDWILTEVIESDFDSHSRGVASVWRISPQPVLYLRDGGGHVEASGDVHVYICQCVCQTVTWFGSVKTTSVTTLPCSCGILAAGFKVKESNFAFGKLRQ